MASREDVLAAVNAVFDKDEAAPLIPTATPAPATPSDQAASMAPVEPQPLPETNRPEPEGNVVQAVNNTDDTGATVPSTEETDQTLVQTLEGLGPKAIDRLKELLK